jgi:collagenase-like PrtC family protease
MRTVSPDQLNGGQLTTVESSDWNLILPYLLENERLFSVNVGDLLKIEGRMAEPSMVYRKVEAIPLKALLTLNE